MSYDRGFKFRGHRPNNLIGASFSDPLADVLQKSWMNYMAQGHWTSTITNRLLFDFGVTYMPVYYNLGFEPGTGPSPSRSTTSSTSTILKVTPREDFDRGAYTTYCGESAYVTGSHNLKTGIQTRVGYFQESFHMNGDMVQILSNGVPTSVRIYNTPLTHREDMDPDLGWYLQDSWRLQSPDQLEPRHPFRSHGDEYSGAGRAGRILGSGAIVSGPERHRRLEHLVAAHRFRMGCVRQWKDGRQGRDQQVRRAGGQLARPKRESELHRV